MTKTNAIRILEQAGVEFSVSEYPVDESTLDAVSVAELLGVEAERVFKTLVTVSESGDHAVFCIPGNASLDLKKAAAAFGAGHRASGAGHSGAGHSGAGHQGTGRPGRLAMLPLKELKPLTGYIHGACSPFGMKKALPTFVDESVELFETVFVSAGVRGMQIEIAPADLSAISGATLADLTAR
ncbi:MAG: aminoacyl-tRNA deacylase [Spirochaetaceae bacterium]